MKGFNSFGVLNQFFMKLGIEVKTIFGTIGLTPFVVDGAPVDLN